MRVLLEEGHDVQAFEDGHAGLEAASGAPYDLVITNHHAAHLTGEQLIEHLARLIAESEKQIAVARRRSFRVAAGQHPLTAGS